MLDSSILSKATEAEVSEYFVHVIYERDSFGMGMVFDHNGSFVYAMNQQEVEHIRKNNYIEQSDQKELFHLVDPFDPSSLNKTIQCQAINNFNIYFSKLFREGSPITDSYELFSHWVQKMLDRHCTQNAVILDFGCGHSRYNDLLKKYSNEVITTDLEIPNNLCDKKDGSKHVYLKDSKTCHIPLTNSSISFVTVNFVLEHVADVTSVITEIQRLLKTHGRVLFSIPALRLNQAVLAYFFNQPIFIPINHVRTFSAFTSGYCNSIPLLIQELERNQLKVVDICSIKTPEHKSSYIAWCEQILGSIWPFYYFGDQIILVAEKQA